MVSLTVSLLLWDFFHNYMNLESFYLVKNFISTNYQIYIILQSSDNNFSGMSYQMPCAVRNQIYIWNSYPEN